jgi:hypothetical protein
VAVPAEDLTAPGNGRLTVELITSLWRSVEVQLAPTAGVDGQALGNEGDHDESAIWVPTWPPGGQAHQRREPEPVPGGDAQVTMVVRLTCMRGYGRLHL